MSPRAPLAAAAAMALAGAMACTEPTPPSRFPSYPFAFVDNGDTLVFHWPADRLPVRYYAAPQGNLPFLVQRAVDAWAGLFLYDEFSGTLVADSTRADVIVRWSDSVPPDVPPDTTDTVVACSEVTQIPPIDSATRRLTGPIRIYVSVLAGYTPGEVEACVRRTTIHEVGHSIGLFVHSQAPAPGDIMNPTPLVALPTDEDRNTAEALYHTSPTVLPPP